MFCSTKTYSHSTGLSVAIRQHRSDSHCQFLHGYSLSVKFVFQASELDARGWVVDFGGLKDLRSWLEHWFDHTTLIAEDDPELVTFKGLHEKGILQLRVMEQVGDGYMGGCEYLAYLIYQYTETWLTGAGFSPRVDLVSVEVSEHEGNSSLYRAD